MDSEFLPSWLPDWDGIEVIVRGADPDRLKRVVRELVGSILTESTIVLDSLEPDLEAALVPPLNTLARVYDDQASLEELVVASRLVRRSALPYLADAPNEIRLLIESLPE
ncbi:hypothetical protein [Goodfellowiella coeruleoviolacea]|uniref:hypothetical protein n=1 Tax=Goodfellowiella coeruleoviolacea TaxID=334858 RepID=UPI0020A4B4EA|nr:hypothetical protein [Goodfellowiella coeruleoviolacea]